MPGIMAAVDSEADSAGDEARMPRTGDSSGVDEHQPHTLRTFSQNG